VGPLTARDGWRQTVSSHDPAGSEQGQSEQLVPYEKAPRWRRDSNRRSPSGRAYHAGGAGKEVGRAETTIMRGGSNPFRSSAEPVADWSRGVRSDAARPHRRAIPRISLPLASTRLRGAAL
jgi:hypothetical protein